MMMLSCVYRCRIFSRSRYTAAPIAAATSTPTCRPCQPRRRASAASPAPMRCATSVLDAFAIASGIMNISETRFTAI